METKEQPKSPFYYLLTEGIESLFEPCATILESDEEISTQEMIRRMRLEIPVDFMAVDLINALQDLGFIKLAIDGAGYWIVKHAASPEMD